MATPAYRCTRVRTRVASGRIAVIRCFPFPPDRTVLFIARSNPGMVRYLTGYLMHSPWNYQKFRPNRSSVRFDHVPFLRFLWQKILGSKGIRGILVWPRIYRLYGKRFLNLIEPRAIPAWQLLRFSVFVYFNTLGNLL